MRYAFPPAMLLANIRYAIRLLLRSPGFAVAALTVIALGIGVTTSVFTVVRAVLLTPLPYPDPARLVSVRANDPALARPGPLTMAEFAALRDRTDLFRAVATANASEGNLTAANDMESVSAASVSDELMPTLGVSTFAGRPVSNAEDTAAGRVTGVNISYELWQRRWRGDPTLVGRTVEINNRPMTIVGILPADLRLYLGSAAGLPTQIDVWFPGAPDTGPRNRAVPTIARLNDAVPLSAAQSALNEWMAGFAAERPSDYPTGPVSLSLTPLNDDVAHDVRPALLALAGAVGFVLLVACANLGNLILARTLARRRELSLRAAIGATRGQLVIQLVVEAATLASLGVVGGLLVTQWAIDGLRWLAPASLPRRELIAVDLPVALFAIAVSFSCALVAGLLAAWSATRRDASNALRGDPDALPSARSTRAALVSSQIALSLVLLVGAGLLTRAFINLRNVPLGFDPEGVVSMQIQLPLSRSTATTTEQLFDTTEKRLAFLTAAASTAREVAGVRDAGIGFPLPLERFQLWQQVAARIDGPAQTVSTLIALPGYLETLRVPLRSGRLFNETDQRRDMPAIVDEELATAFFGSTEVTGRRVYLRAANGTNREAEVIGVAGSIRQMNLRAAPSPQIWLPYSMRAFAGVSLVFRTDGDPVRVAAAVEEAIEGLAPGRPISRVRPLSDYVDAAVADTRFAIFVIGAFAVLAMVLTGVGVYGIAAYSTERRRREIAVRMALGANAGRVVSLVLREATALTICGVAGGIATSLAVTRYLETLLFQVDSRDASTFVVVVLVIVAVALTATLIPAIRAVTVDPMRALRAD